MSSTSAPPPSKAVGTSSPRLAQPTPRRPSVSFDLEPTTIRPRTTTTTTSCNTANISGKSLPSRLQKLSLGTGTDTDSTGTSSMTTTGRKGARPGVQTWHTPIPSPYPLDAYARSRRNDKKPTMSKMSKHAESYGQRTSDANVSTRSDDNDGGDNDSDSDEEESSSAEDIPQRLVRPSRGSSSASSASSASSSLSATTTSSRPRQSSASSVSSKGSYSTSASNTANVQTTQCIHTNSRTETKPTSTNNKAASVNSGSIRRPSFTAGQQGRRWSLIGNPLAKNSSKKEIVRYSLDEGE